MAVRAVKARRSAVVLRLEFCLVVLRHVNPTKISKAQFNKAASPCAVFFNALKRHSIAPKNMRKRGAVFNVCHALNSPLNAICDAADTLADALRDDAGFTLNAGCCDNLRHDNPIPRPRGRLDSLPRPGGRGAGCPKTR